VAPITAGAAAPPGLSARVAGEIAGRWRVPVERIAVEWGRLPAIAPDDASPIRLAGRGGDGWFVVQLGQGDSAAAVRVRAGVRDTAVVAARALASGERLAPADVRDEPKVRWGPPRPSAAGRPGPGWEVRRPVAAGEEIGWPSVVPPPAIAAGEPVELVWMRGSVRVSVTGIAVHAARLGEKVRVRLEGVSEQRVGTAVGPGLATLTRGEMP
jgi:flagella basal body P-ring formation protein FlgA